MDLPELLLRFGYALVFFSVLLDQLGIPIPSPVVLLAAGAGAAGGQLAIVPALALAVVAALAGNFLWYELGRRRGIQVVGILCRFALEPDSCVSRSQRLFARQGAIALVVAKFVPGLATVSPPLAGAFHLSPRRFLAIDGLACVVWAGAFLGLGFVFGDSLERLADWTSSVGGSLLALGAAGIALWILGKLVARTWILRRLRLARITPEELRSRIDAGEDVMLVDLRHPLDFAADPVWIPGAIRLDPARLDEQYGSLPRDREIVLYCTCPNEASSARVALRLRRHGLQRVRPLQGGLDGWRGRGLPLASG
jgi:membrane protein DedA with SNARE-associated domain/rhodanese-related sulfurtransferase